MQLTAVISAVYQGLLEVPASSIIVTSPQALRAPEPEARTVTLSALLSAVSGTYSLLPFGT